MSLPEYDTRLAFQMPTLSAKREHVLARIMAQQANRDMKAAKARNGEMFRVQRTPEVVNLDRDEDVLAAIREAGEIKVMDLARKLGLERNVVFDSVSRLKRADRVRWRKTGEGQGSKFRCVYYLRAVE